MAVDCPQARAFGADINADGLINEFDVNLLTGGIATGSGDPALDVNLDGNVDTFDLDDWFNAYSFESGVPLAIALVDVDFDQVNTIADLQIIEANLGVFTTNFTDGNLFPDTLVDSVDRDLYVSRGGIVVPEPASGLLVLLGLSAMAFACRAKAAKR